MSEGQRPLASVNSCQVITYFIKISMIISGIAEDAWCN